MCHGFYAVDAFYLYSPAIDKLIGAGGYVDAGLFRQMNWMKERLMPYEQVPELAQMQEGWYLYRNFSLYTRHVSNGLLIAVINPRYMVDLNDFNQLYPGQHMVVINKEGRYFASSLGSDEKGIADWSVFEEGDLIELNEKKYKSKHIARMQEADSGKGLCVVLQPRWQTLPEEVIIPVIELFLKEE